MLLSQIPKLVINLESRPDRLELARKELDGMGAYIMPGFIEKDPMIGIAKAHLNCIAHAKEKDWPVVLIMEDDVMLRPKCKEYLDEALKHLPDNWELLLGGVYEENKLQQYNEYWDSIGEFCGLHFYIVNKSAYEKILEYNYNLHIDRWMNYNGKRLNAYLTKKYVATQRDGYSDNVKANTSYNELLLKKKKLL